MPDSKTVSAKEPTRAPVAAPLAKPVKAPPFQIMSMEERNLNRYLKMLIYGEYGIGKTTLAASCAQVPQMQDAILLNIESGDLSISEQEGLDVATVKDYRSAARVLDYLKVHCVARDNDDEDKLREYEAQLRPGITFEGRNARRYRTCIIDSLTELDSLSMQRIQGITDSMPLDQDVDPAQWGEYRQNFNLMQRLIRTYRDLPMNVIFICGASYTQDEQKRFNYVPMMTGKLSNQVQGFVDVVGYMRMDQANEKMVRRMFVQPVGRFAAKCRFAAYKKPYFDDPTIGGILQSVGLIQPNK